MEVSQPKNPNTTLISVSTLPYHVQLVNIYLSTATFDEIEKDVKVTTEFAALGVIGGTEASFTIIVLILIPNIYYQGDN